MPPGRFVSGVTQTSVSEVTVIGVCNPWFGSRTEARRKVKRKMPWENHEQYLASQTEVLGQTPAKRLTLIGNFNQTIRARQPRTVLRFDWRSGEPSRRASESLRRILPSRDAEASTTVLEATAEETLARMPALVLAAIVRATVIVCERPIATTLPGPLVDCLTCP